MRSWAGPLKRDHGAIMAIGTLNQTLRTLREIDLKSLRRAAEASFRLYLCGEVEDELWLAALLSARPAETGQHPWLVLRSASGLLQAGKDLGSPGERLAILLIREPELSTAEQAQVTAFGSAGVPVITAVIRTDRALPLTAELPRTGEAARAILARSGGGATADLAPLAKALLRATEDRPGMRLALARQLPALRPIVVEGLIDDTSSSNAVYALSTGIAEVTPGLSLAIGPADILVLTKNQLMLAFKISLATGRTGSNRQLLSQVVSVIGSGLLLRQIAQELVGMLPVIGLVPKVAVAYAGTQVIGQTVWAWADSGHRLGRSELRQRYRQALIAASAWARRALPGKSDKAPDGVSSGDGGDIVSTGPSQAS